jgi:hypothetical protein
MAIANSTVPKLGARWPPFFDTTSMMTCRISDAREGRSFLGIFFKSAGESILSRKLKIYITPYLMNS